MRLASGLETEGKFSKTTLWVIIILTLSTQFIFPMISGVFALAKDGDWKPLVQASVGKLVDTQEDIHNGMEKLKAIRDNPKQYDEFDVDAARTKIAWAFAFNILLIILIYKFLTWERLAATLGYHSTGIFYALVMVLIALFILAFTQLSWTIFENKSIENKSWQEAFSSIDVFKTGKDAPYVPHFKFLFNLGLLDVKGTKEIKDG